MRARRKCRSRSCCYSRRQSRVLKAHLPLGRQVYFLCPLLGMNPGRQVYSTSSPTSYTFLSTLIVANRTSGGLGQTGGEEIFYKELGKKIGAVFVSQLEAEDSLLFWVTVSPCPELHCSFVSLRQLMVAISISQKKTCCSSPQQLYQWPQLYSVSLF